MSEHNRSQAISAAAKALRRHSKRTVKHHVNEPMFGTVVDTSPLLVDVDGILLDEDELTLCQQVRIYDRDHTIDVDDKLLIHALRNGEWLATAVISDKSVTPAVP